MLFIWSKDFLFTLYANKSLMFKSSQLENSSFYLFHKWLLSTYNILGYSGATKILKNTTLPRRASQASGRAWKNLRLWYTETLNGLTFFRLRDVLHTYFVPGAGDLQRNRDEWNNRCLGDHILAGKMIYDRPRVKAPHDTSNNSYEAEQCSPEKGLSACNRGSHWRELSKLGLE